VEEFAQIAFAAADLDWREHVVIDPSLYRPAEVHLLLGDASKATRELGWTCKTVFHKLVHEMLAADLAAQNCPSAGVMAG